MPVIVVGADTETGRVVTDRLLRPDREVRVFVTDPDEADGFRSRGAKVALGDLSDDTHLSGACLNCFTAVLVGAAAGDERERSFAQSPGEVFAAWAAAVSAAGVHRVIWVVDGAHPSVEGVEQASVRPDDPDLAQTVFDLDSARRV